MLRTIEGAFASQYYTGSALCASHVVLLRQWNGQTKPNAFCDTRQGRRNNAELYGYT